MITIMGTTSSPRAASATPAKSAAPPDDAIGLSSEEASSRLRKDGPNAMPDTALRDAPDLPDIFGPISSYEMAQYRPGDSVL